MNPKRRTIKAILVVQDIEQGLTDPQLMEKYDISPKQLEMLLDQLLSRKLITRQQLDRRVSMADTAITKAFVEVDQSIRELETSTEVTQQTWELNQLVQALHDAQGITAPPPPGRPSGPSKVKAGDLVQDIRSGFTDSQLMEKYGMAPRQLESIYCKLVEAGRITAEELYNRSNTVTDSSITRAFVDVYRFMKELD